MHPLLTYSKKDSSQEVVISLFGMLVGSLVVSRISSQWATWTAMILLLAVHLGTNYLAVRAVSMRTLNRQRANLVFSAYLDSNDHVRDHKSTQNIPTPEEISIQERVFEKDGVLRWKGGIILGYCEIGVSLRRILDLVSKPDASSGSYTGPQSSDARRLLDEFEQDDYVLWYNQPSRTFLIVLKSSSTVTTQLHAWMHALFLAKQFHQGAEDKSVLGSIIRTHSDFKAIASEGLNMQLEKAGWDIKTGALETRSGTRIKKDDSDTPT